MKVTTYAEFIWKDLGKNKEPRFILEKVKEESYDYQGKVSLCNTKSTTQVPKPTPEQRRSYDVSARLGEEQLSAIQRQQGYQSQLGDLFSSLKDELGQDTSSGINFNGEPTDFERNQIGTLADQTLGLGYSDIDAGTQQGLNMLRDTLSPSRGLRPGDTPIVDRGLMLATEAQRQKGQLSRQVRGQQAQNLLDVPGQRANLMNSLKQSAVNNRLTLLGLITGQNPGFSSSTPNFGSQGSSTSTSNPAGTLSGVGTALYGGSKAYTSLFGTTAAATDTGLSAADLLAAGMAVP